MAVWRSLPDISKYDRAWLASADPVMAMNWDTDSSMLVSSILILYVVWMCVFVYSYNGWMDGWMVGGLINY